MTHPSETQIPSTPPKSVSNSVIAQEMTIEGSISGDCTLQLDGKLKGEIKVKALVVGNTGALDGSVTAESVEIRGRVSGTVSARQVRLHASAHVEGDIHQEQLSIENGAFFQGSSLKLAAAAPARSAPAPAADKKADPA